MGSDAARNLKRGVGIWCGCHEPTNLFLTFVLQVDARLDTIEQKVDLLLARMEREDLMREEEGRRRQRAALQHQ